MYMHTHTSTPKYTHAHIRIYPPTLPPTHIRTYTHANTYQHTHTHKHIHTHTHTHTTHTHTHPTHTPILKSCSLRWAEVEPTKIQCSPERGSRHGVGAKLVVVPQELQDTNPLLCYLWGTCT